MPRKEKFIPLYLDDPTYGSAWVSNECLIEPGNQRFFARIKYRFPSDKLDRFQAFYQSSGTNTGHKGTWFPCDGLVLRGNPNATMTQSDIKLTMLLQKGYISKPILTRSATRNRSSTILSKRFGSPIFVFISRHLQFVHQFPLPESSNLFQDLNEYSNIMRQLKATDPHYFGPAPASIPDMICHEIPRDQDPEMVMNRFIGDAISINWLYNIPSGISSFPDEYYEMTKLMTKEPIDFNKIYNGQELRVPITTKLSEVIVPYMKLKDDSIVIPDYIIDGHQLQNWKGLALKYEYSIRRDRWSTEVPAVRQEPINSTKRPAQTPLRRSARLKKK